MNEIDTTTKSKIISIIKALVPHTKIYLFDLASGTAGKWSDIDIALNAGKPLPLTTIDEIMSIFQATNIPYKIEVVDMHQVNKEMQHAIQSEGTKIGNLKITPTSTFKCALKLAESIDLLEDLQYQKIFKALRDLNSAF